MEKTIERKAMFEEATRCPECYSDKIYVFQDSDGGLCTKCKCLLTGQIKGGISKAELMRLRGEIPTEDTVNEKDRKAEEAEKAKQDVAKLKEDMARLNKSQIMSPVKDAPKTPKIEGPSIIEKAKAWLFNPDKPKAAGAVAPKASPPPAAPPTPPIVKAPPVKETGLPMPGEAWSVGKCSPCRLDGRYTGKVLRSKASRTSERFLEITTSTGTVYGCFFCAKKS
jgi:hypothetical protein